MIKGFTIDDERLKGNGEEITGKNYWIESGISNLQKVLDSLSSYLTEEYGRGFSRSNVAGMRQFYMAIQR